MGLSKKQRLRSSENSGIPRHSEAREKNVGGYSNRLGGFEARTKALGGTIAARSFRKVLSRIADVVLVADVGLIDVAWKQKDDKSKDIENVIDKQRVEYNGIESIFGEVTGD